MRGQDAAAPLHEGLGEEAMRAAREALIRERGHKRLRTADLTFGALLFVLCVTILVNALVLQASSSFSPLPPHRPGAAGHGPDKARGAEASPSPAPARSSASASAAVGGMTEGTLGYLVTRTTAVDTPAPAPAVARGGPESVRRPLSAIGSAPEPEITGAVRPPVDVPGSSRILAVQRTLSRLGYGPLKVDGQAGTQTRLAIQRFQRDRNLSADGQISDRLVRELASVSGSAID